MPHQSGSAGIRGGVFQIPSERHCVQSLGAIRNGQFFAGFGGIICTGNLLMAWSGKKSLSINGFLCADPSRAVRKAVIYANPSRAAGKTDVFAEIVIAPEPAQERFRQTAGKVGKLHDAELS